MGVWAFDDEMNSVERHVEFVHCCEEFSPRLYGRDVGATNQHNVPSTVERAERIIRYPSSCVENNGLVLTCKAVNDSKRIEWVQTVCCDRVMRGAEHLETTGVS